MRAIPERILVMQTGGWIGDMIMLTPALRALRREYPEAYIGMLVNPLVQDLMERNPYLDEVIVYDKRGRHRGIRRMWRMADKLNVKGFDTAVILHPNSIRSALLAFTAAIPQRIGAEVRGREYLLTTKVKHRDNIHEVQRYLDVVSPIVGKDHDKRLEFWGVDRDDEGFVDNVLAHRASPVIGVNASTTWQSKHWPAERFAHLADSLYHRFDANVALTGSSADVGLGSEIMRQASSAPLNLVGSTNLWQLGALIKRCRLYITCDSGPMHIAAAIGTPAVALFGPTDPTRHGPYGQGHVVVRKDIPCSPCYERECKRRDCMRAIRVEDVMDALDRLMG